MPSWNMPLLWARKEVSFPNKDFRSAKVSLQICTLNTPFPHIKGVMKLPSVCQAQCQKVAPDNFSLLLWDHGLPRTVWSSHSF